MPYTNLYCPLSVVQSSLNERAYYKKFTRTQGKALTISHLNSLDYNDCKFLPRRVTLVGIV